MKKNLLFLMADQFAYDALGYITPGIRTPCLNQLAKESIRFTNCYTNAPL